MGDVFILCRSAKNEPRKPNSAFGRVMGDFACSHSEHRAGRERKTLLFPLCLRVRGMPFGNPHLARPESQMFSTFPLGCGRGVDAQNLRWLRKFLAAYDTRARFFASPCRASLWCRKMRSKGILRCFPAGASRAAGKFWLTMRRV